MSEYRRHVAGSGSEHGAEILRGLVAEALGRTPTDDDIVEAYGDLYSRPAVDDAIEAYRAESDADVDPETAPALERGLAADDVAVIIAVRAALSLPVLC